jgi:hypothetical protein
MPVVNSIITHIYAIIHVILTFNSNPSASYEIHHIFPDTFLPASYKYLRFSSIQTKTG